MDGWSRNYKGAENCYLYDEFFVLGVRTDDRENRLHNDIMIMIVQDERFGKSTFWRLAISIIHFRRRRRHVPRKEIHQWGISGGPLKDDVDVDSDLSFSITSGTPG